MNALRWLAVAWTVVALFALGCSDTKTPNATATSNGRSFLPNLDPGRLRYPPKWKAFDQRVQDAALVKPITIEEAPALLADARSFATSDRRGHAHSVFSIPKCMMYCAQVLCEAGKTDESVSVLNEVREFGGVFMDMLEHESFDAIKTTPEFESMRQFAENETASDILANYLIRKPALFSIAEVAALKTDPPLPQDLSTEITMLFTGSHLSDADIELLDLGVAEEIRVIAIVNKLPNQQPAGVSFHGCADDLKVDASATMDPGCFFWFSDRSGQVVAYLRPLSYSKSVPAIIQRLKK